MGTKNELVSPCLRPDLIIEQQRDGSALRYLIVDPVRNRYWQCGSAQYQLLTFLTGELAPGDIVTQYREQTHLPLRPEQLDAVLRKLDSLGFLMHTDLGLVTLPPAIGGAAHRPFHFQDYVSKRWRVYPAYRLLHPLEASTRWLFTPGFLAVCALLTLCAGWVLIEGGWRQGVIPIWSDLYLHPSLLVWGRLIVALVMTGVMHECAHALTLLHFKRKPGFFGLGASLLVGLFFYVEISEIWFLSQRWQRVLVSLAGPLASLVVGAVGAMVWWLLPRSSPLSAWAAAFMAVGCLTALYNCLPFFRTDGYFALSDWLRIPNLDRKARTYLGQTLFRRLRRQSEPKPRLPLRQRILLAAYGVIASLVALWFVLIVIDFCSWLVVLVVRHL